MLYPRNKDNALAPRMNAEERNRVIASDWGLLGSDIVDFIGQADAVHTMRLIVFAPDASVSLALDRRRSKDGSLSDSSA